MTDKAAVTLARTPLADWHASHGARLVDFAGWAMPIQYGSIVDEHNATRSAVGLFDVSHMGRLTITGAQPGAWLDNLVTRRIIDLRPGRVRYSLVCNEAGGVLDDILITCVEQDRFDLVVNASNRAKLLEWFDAFGASDEATLVDRTESTAMIAVQGPRAVETVVRLSGEDVSQLRYYTAQADVDVAGVRCDVSRTGYTGEDGLELICEAEHAEKLWQALAATGATPCGLASRDTLRLEAGMPLYGHELNETLNPIQAGLQFAVSYEDKQGVPRNFVGHEALREASNNKKQPVRVGLQAEGRRAPREGYSVINNDEQCGVVTSGTQSPTLGYPIAMAYVSQDSKDIGAELQVDVRGTMINAKVVDMPFYKRA